MSLTEQVVFVFGRLESDIDVNGTTVHSCWNQMTNTSCARSLCEPDRREMLDGEGSSKSDGLLVCTVTPVCSPFRPRGCERFRVSYQLVVFLNRSHVAKRLDLGVLLNKTTHYGGSLRRFRWGLF